MISKNNLDHLLTSDGNVLDPQGDKIGSIGQIYLNDQTGEPAWVTVNTGLFGLSENFIPLDGATVEGDDIRVAYTKDRVKDAPSIDPDGHLEVDEEQRLYEYYGVGDAYTTTDRRHRDDTLGDDTTARDTRTETDLKDAYGKDTHVGGQDYDRDVHRDTDREGEMTLAEERVNVGTESHESGRVRLRKHVVTENVTKTVPVQREEVSVERVPADGDEHVGELGDDETEVTLHEETPVVEKDTVAKEKVRLNKETVTDQETVSADVRHEEVDTENVDRDRDRF